MIHGSFTANVLRAGVDEAGRGPLAGPVVAAAVIFGSLPVAGVRDSKKLSASRRKVLAAVIRRQALAWCVAEADVHEIEALNILHATMLAMSRAVMGLAIRPGLVLIDGNRVPPDLPSAVAIVRGDETEPAVSAASILAKVARDQIMQRLDFAYPEYGFARHKGYPTKEHVQALEIHGPTPHHRRLFGPVKRVIEQRRQGRF